MPDAAFLLLLKRRRGIESVIRTMDGGGWRLACRDRCHASVTWSGGRGQWFGRVRAARVLLQWRVLCRRAEVRERVEHWQPVC